MEITEIKTRLTLSEVIRHYGLKADKQNRLRCPFHEDKTPSLQLYYKTQTAYCFSSNCRTHGKSMDVIDFILHKENCTKAEAIEKAKQLIHSPLNPPKGDFKKSPTNLSEGEALERKSLFLESMFQYFCNAIYNSKPAQDYLASRSLKAPFGGLGAVGLWSSKTVRLQMCILEMQKLEQKVLVQLGIGLNNT